MLKYGEVIPGSVRRAYIKDTHVENGSRYLKILNYVPTLPNRTKFTCVEELVFADNNRTECIHCGKNTHPSYSCRQKLTFKKGVLTVQGISLGIVRMIQSALTVKTDDQSKHDCELCKVEQVSI